jgi:hypothetical protein
MPENQAAYGTQKRESGVNAVSLRPCELLALIPVNENKTKSNANSDRKMAAARGLGVAGR